MNTLGSEIKKNEAKMHFSHQAHCQKGENDHFSFILSFNLTKKWNENAMIKISYNRLLVVLSNLNCFMTES